jgi:arabinose-5-phosphate isomerase
MSVLATVTSLIDDLSEARRVLTNEAEALVALKEALDHNFVKAVDIFFNTKGRVVVTGMGKSGHIARKIAATLASTGTPSLFVHPAEASHGDLGMISFQDSLLALSNSGETAELSSILTYAKRRNINLVAITSQKESTLAETADAMLLLPAFQEACPLKLAPTTSTTMMMALGDALATALLMRKNFSPDDFGQLHPGGRLGQTLLCVHQIMHKDEELPLVSPHMLMNEVLLVMTAKRFGCAGVLDEKTEALTGVITDGDLRRHMASDFLSLKAVDVMTPKPYTIRSTAMAQEALAFMNTKNITSLFVVEKKASLKPVGIIHVHDCLRAGIS